MSYIKRMCVIWRKAWWLRRIDKEIDRCSRLKRKVNRQLYVIKQMSDGYNEEFGETLFKGESTNAI